MPKKTSKATKRDRASAAHANRVSRVMVKVTEMLDRAMEELVSQPADLEELESLLNEVVK